jgi:hypothetical protein
MSLELVSRPLLRSKIAELVAGIKRKVPQLEAAGLRARRTASQITGADAEE